METINSDSTYSWRNTIVRKAVILAAGFGSRLRNVIDDRPKGFLVIGDKPIIEQSIAKLVAHGIEQIIIGTGCKSEAYEELSHRNPVVCYRKNERYQSTGSMYTLFNLRDRIDGDFLLLESHLIYDKTALTVLLNDFHRDVILASGKTNFSDEVFIDTNDDGFLVRMSKNPAEVCSQDTELIGISKISMDTFAAMCAYGERHFLRCQPLGYEDAVVGIAGERDIYVKRIEDFPWCRIDDEVHLNRAITEVLPRIQSRETLQSVKRNVLLNPGPATTTDSVKFAQVTPDICPREREFGEMMKNVSDDLVRFVADTEEYTAVLFCGSGTASVEVMLSSVIDQNERLLIVNNGAYGERIRLIAETYGLDYVEYKSMPDRAIDLKSLEAMIMNESSPITYLAVVHNETTTGLLNDIGAIGGICERHHITMIIDAISSFSAIPINMKEMNISFLAASSNKNIQGMPGVSFVIAANKAIEGTRFIKPRNLYLHLYSEYKHFKETCQMRFTAPVQTLYALRQAILETKLEGIERRYSRYKEMWDMLVKGAEQLGLKHIVPKEHHSKLVTAFLEPDGQGYDFQEMHDFLYGRGFTIYPGKIGDMRTFRLSTMGAIYPSDIQQFLIHLKEYLDVSQGICTSKEKE